MPPVPRKGPVEAAVTADVGKLPESERGSGMAVLALSLARQMDRAGSPQVARELRATLLEVLADVPEERGESDLDRLRARKAR